MWGTVANRDGVVCAVALTGGDRGDQRPGLFGKDRPADQSSQPIITVSVRPEAAVRLKRRKRSLVIGGKRPRGIPGEVTSLVGSYRFV